MNTQYLIVCCILSVCYGQCDEERSCIGQTFTSTGSGYTYIDGYKAAYGPSTSWSGDGIYCGGSFSCHSISFLIAHKDSIKCRGSASCANTTIQNNISPIYCSGSNACIGSNITTISDNFVNCDGYQSCAHSYIHGAESVDANGQFSLYNATIDTIGSVTSISINLDGSFAGFGAKLLCRKDHTCNIQCRTLNACFMFYIECEGICNIYTLSDDVIAPIRNITQFNNDITNYTLFESESVIERDESCIIDEWRFDDDKEQQYASNITINTDNNSSVCCRGYESCAVINLIEFQTETKQYLICSANKGCYDSNIKSNNNSIYCEGESGCSYSSVTNAGYVHCSGYRGCQYSTITKARLVSCSGRDSCGQASFVSDGIDMNVYFVGEGSATDVRLYCNDTDVCNVYCMGYNGCVGTVLFCNDNCDVLCNDAISTCPVISDRSNAPTVTSQAPTQHPSLNPSETPSTSNTVVIDTSKSFHTEQTVIDTEQTVVNISIGNESSTTGYKYGITASAQETIMTSIHHTLHSSNDDIDNYNVFMMIVWIIIGCLICVGICCVVKVVMSCLKHQKAKKDLNMVKISPRKDALNKTPQINENDDIGDTKATHIVGTELNNNLDKNGENEEYMSNMTSEENVKADANLSPHKIHYVFDGEGDEEIVDDNHVTEGIDQNILKDDEFEVMGDDFNTAGNTAGAYK